MVKYDMIFEIKKRWKKPKKDRIFDTWEKYS